jgi:hypothetical protein
MREIKIILISVLILTGYECMMRTTAIEIEPLPIPLTFKPLNP